MLEKEGLSAVKVIGCGCISDGFVVIAAGKKAVVIHMQDTRLCDPGR